MHIAHSEGRGRRLSPLGTAARAAGVLTLSLITLSACSIPRLAGGPEADIDPSVVSSLFGEEDTPAGYSFSSGSIELSATEHLDESNDSWQSLGGTPDTCRPYYFATSLSADRDADSMADDVVYKLGTISDEIGTTVAISARIFADTDAAEKFVAEAQRVARECSDGYSLANDSTWITTKVTVAGDRSLENDGAVAATQFVEDVDAPDSSSGFRATLLQTGNVVALISETLGVMEEPDYSTGQNIAALIADRLAGAA